jgi:hypothetical protein
MRVQEPIVRIHGFTVVGIGLLSWITMAALAAMIFVKQHLFDHVASSPGTTGIESAGLLLMMVLSAWALQTAARELAITRFVFRKPGIRRV